MFGAANEFDPAEEGDSARQKHGKGPQLEAPFLASVGSRRIPSAEGPAIALVVNVVEETVLGD